MYFLTEITENDLLNTTSGNSQTLPKNSAALESAVPIKESVLPNNNGKAPEDTLQEGETVKETDYTENMERTEETKPEEKAEEPNPAVSYLILGVLAAVFIGGVCYFKVI